MIIEKQDKNNDLILPLFFERVFSDSEGAEEGKILKQLVCDLLQTTPNEDLIVFVAKEKEEIIGSIIFSKVTFGSFKNAFILSPVAIATSHQKQGIGQQLINEGKKYLKEQNVELLLTYGDPNYYAKVGFKAIKEEQIKAPYALSFPHGWLAQSLNNNALPIIKEKPQCVLALSHQHYW